ncbi:hypothetical protein [Paenibacillus donghaensis]|uniref:Uncharacterized protein n=1 Tax=Paenibacillus donghaensis TaxID=414771 RepID=A0A2Z2KPA4_9BACL|nr:hypothetical protein [Paenibacillus donghaensis]ASA22041.1 hypothetical protein B9T62_15415 [Paenibacillus donghaensis]
MDKITLQHYVDRANKGLAIVAKIDLLKKDLKNIQFADSIKFQDMYGNLQSLIAKNRSNGKTDETFPAIVNGIIQAAQKLIEQEIQLLEEELAAL